MLRATRSKWGQPAMQRRQCTPDPCRGPTRSGPANTARVQALFDGRQDNQSGTGPPEILTLRGDVEPRLAETDHCRRSSGGQVSRITCRRTAPTSSDLPNPALVDQAARVPAPLRAAPPILEKPISDSR